jgi:transcriptional regulator with XRE-family HTH domain
VAGRFFVWIASSPISAFSALWVTRPHSPSILGAMQAFCPATAQDLQDHAYDAAMPKAKDRPEFARRLVELRQAAGLSQLQLAERVGTHHSNIGFWETSGTCPRGEVLPSLAQALGVSTDELLGVTPAKPKPAPKGRLQKVFEAASKLPRRQQDKIADVLEAFVAQHSGKAA